MKIKMIGTGSISAKERSASCLIDDKILVDCGNGIIKTLLEQNVDINKIDTLLITHLHGDHFLDIPFLIIQRSFSTPNNELHIYCPKETENIVAKIMKLAYPNTKDWIKLKDKSKVKFIEFVSLNNVEITKGYFADSYQVIHGNFEPAYGYVIKNNNKAIGFSGDSSYCESIDKIIENSNIAILDTSFVDSNEQHMGVHDIEMLSNKYNQKIIPTHMDHSARQYMIDNKSNNIIVLNDGEEIEI